MAEFSLPGPLPPSSFLSFSYQYPRGQLEAKKAQTPTEMLATGARVKIEIKNLVTSYQLSIKHYFIMLTKLNACCKVYFMSSLYIKVIFLTCRQS